MVPVLLYRCEIWVSAIKIANKIIFWKYEFYENDKKLYTSQDHLQNEDIKKELQIFSINYKIQKYHMAWSQHLDRMEDIRLPKLAIRYGPLQKRNVGRTEGTMERFAVKVQQALCQ